MVYKVIGLMSGSSLDGLDIIYVHLQEQVGRWEYAFVQAECVAYPGEWRGRLESAGRLSALEYQLLHVDYGHWLGERVREFISKYGLDYQVQLVASHGHTTLHTPGRRMTAQLGDGAAVAAVTGINVVSDLRAMDIALGGQGAPIVPMGEKLLLGDHALFLNLGGIANVTGHGEDGGREKTAGQGKGGGQGKGAGYSEAWKAFDICPANRVLNMLAAREGKPFDEGGAMAAAGHVDEALLERLNALDYYQRGYPKSLASEFGTDEVMPMIVEAMDGVGSPKGAGIGTRDALRTYVEHVAVQVREAVVRLGSEIGGKMLVTGGGAHNAFLISRIGALLEPLGIGVVVPDARLVDFKEALVMALLGVLRWREENTVLGSVTGARRDSIGGAVWMGQEG